METLKQDSENNIVYLPKLAKPSQNLSTVTKMTTHERDRHEAVSYTHLDVYKRQIHR